MKVLFEFVFVPEAWVKRLVSDIKFSKSSAMDSLSTKVLKDAFLILTIELTHLYNVCIESGNFPRAWSIGK